MAIGNVETSWGQVLEPKDPQLARGIGAPRGSQRWRLSHAGVKRDALLGKPELEIPQEFFRFPPVRRGHRPEKNRVNTDIRVWKESSARTVEREL
jgi:hypothetical protein